MFVGAFLSSKRLPCVKGCGKTEDIAGRMDIFLQILNNIYTLYKEMIFLFKPGKPADLDRTQLDKLNALQHEITDTSGNGVILVAYCKNCSGCNGCK